MSHRYLVLRGILQNEVEKRVIEGEKMKYLNDITRRPAISETQIQSIWETFNNTLLLQ